MSKLGDKQRRFTYMVAQLIIHAYGLPGYRLTFGDTFRDPRCNYGHPRSLHRSRLAVDFNLFVDGDYIDGSKDEHFLLWERLGKFWESIGGSWGGRFETGPSARDLNHFSLSHDGMS